MKSIKTLFVLMRVVLLGLAACLSPIAGESTEMPVADMQNPAAVYCEGLRYSLDNVIRNGGGDADCIFPDSSRCGQWDFLSGRCGQEHSFCGQQGFVLQEGANIGTCQFPDGSTCDEYLYFSGDCSPGDNPGEVVEEPVQIQDFTQARDFIAAYILYQYGIGQMDPWIEQNITPDGMVGSTTIRFVSGPLTIVISAPVSAPYASLYSIEEASYLVNGFYWEGTLSFDGTITESLVYPPGTILNEQQARDAVMEYITRSLGLPAVGEWVDEGLSPTEAVTMVRVFTSGDWVVEIEFAPSAPLVSSYHVTVDNLSEGIQWEGDISLRGEMVEISFSKGE